MHAMFLYIHLFSVLQPVSVQVCMQIYVGIHWNKCVYLQHSAMLSHTNHLLVDQI